MSVSLLDVHLALRNRARSLVVATTGPISLSATATGYHRAAGSFEADNFEVGMEIVPAGFASNIVDTLIGVTATDLTTKNPRGVEAVAGARTISVGLPVLRALENDPTFTPTVGRPYFNEDFVPGTSTLSGSRRGGYVYDNGLYVAKWYGLSGVGVSALRKSVDALKALFAPGTALTAGTATVRVLPKPAPQTGQIIPLTNGWSALVLTISWEVESINAIAA
jgi:hypothetical protein